MSNNILRKVLLLILFILLFAAGWFRYGIDGGEESFQNEASKPISSDQDELNPKALSSSSYKLPSYNLKPDPEMLPKRQFLNFYSSFISGDFAEVERQIDALQSAFESDIRYENRLSNMFGAFDGGEDIESLLDQWVEKNSSHYAPWLARGIFKYRQGYKARGNKNGRDTPKENFSAMGKYFRLARNDIHEALELKPNLPVAYSFLIKMAAVTGQSHDKYNYYRKAIEQTPDSYIVRREFAYYLQPKWRGSWDVMDSFISNESVRASEQNLLGNLRNKRFNNQGDEFYRKKKYVEAMAMYQAAIDADYSWYPLMKWAKCLGYMGNFQRAVEAVTQSIELYPDNSESLIDRAYYLYNIGQFDLAIADLDAVIELYPNSKSAFDTYAWAHIRKGNYDLADQAFSKAIEIDPRYARALYGKSFVNRVHLTRLDVAEQYANKAYKTKPDPYYWFELLQVHYTSGNSDAPIMAEKYIDLCREHGRCSREWLDWAEGFVICVKGEEDCNWARVHYEKWLNK